MRNAQNLLTSINIINISCENVEKGLQTDNSRLTGINILLEFKNMHCFWLTL